MDVVRVDEAEPFLRRAGSGIAALVPYGFGEYGINNLRGWVIW